jgi:hypothetical protein
MPDLPLKEVGAHDVGSPISSLSLDNYRRSLYRDVDHVTVQLAAGEMSHAIL